MAWKQAVVWLVAVTLLAWTSLAGAAYLFVKYERNFPNVKFSHMLLYPVKKEAFRASRGDYLIIQGKQLLASQKFQEAFNSIAGGLSLSPANREGRLLLAQFYAAWQRPDRAERLLVEGIRHHPDDRAYLQIVFSFLLQRQSDFELIDITADLLSKLDGAPENREVLRLVVLARATALYHRANYDEAEGLLSEKGMQDLLEARLLQLRIDWDRGERESVLSKLEQMSAEAPDNEQIYALHASCLRASGRDGELRRMALLRQIAHPDRAGPRVDLLYLYSKAGDAVSVERGAAEILADFRSNPEALLALADFAANTGRPQLARQVYEHCKANLLPWEGPALMTVEAFVVAGQYRQALAACEQLIRENPEWSRRFQSVFNGLQAVANFGLNDEEAAQLYLGNFLNQSGIRADNLVAVSNRLVTVGAQRQARQVLAQAVKTDPLNQSALVGLIRLDLEAGHADTVATHLRTLLSMRKPPRDLILDASRKLGSDRFLFAPNRAELLDALNQTIGR